MPAPPSSATRAANAAAINRARTSSAPNAAAANASRIAAERQQQTSRTTSAPGKSDREATKTSQTSAAGKTDRETTRSSGAGASLGGFSGGAKQVAERSTANRSLTEKLSQLTRTAPGKTDREPVKLSSSGTGKTDFQGPSLTRSLTQTAAAQPVREASPMETLRALTAPTRPSLSQLVADKAPGPRNTADISDLRDVLVNSEIQNSPSLMRAVNGGTPFSSLPGLNRQPVAASGKTDMLPQGGSTMVQRPVPTMPSRQQAIAAIAGDKSAVRPVAGPVRVSDVPAVPQVTPRNTTVVNGPNGMAPDNILSGLNPQASQAPIQQASTNFLKLQNDLQKLVGSRLQGMDNLVNPEAYRPVSGPETMPDPAEPQGVPSPANGPGINPTQSPMAGQGQSWFQSGQPDMRVSEDPVVAEQLSRFNETFGTRFKSSAPATSEGPSLYDRDMPNIPKPVQRVAQRGTQVGEAVSGTLRPVLDPIDRALGGSGNAPTPNYGAQQAQIRANETQGDKGNKKTQPQAKSNQMTDAEFGIFNTLPATQQSLLTQYMNSGMTFAQAYAKLTAGNPAQGNPPVWNQPQFDPTPLANMTGAPVQVVTALTPIMQAIRDRIYG